MTDTLHGLGTGALTQRRQPGVALAAVGAGDADLDQLMRIEGRVEFINDRLGQPVLADPNEGMAMVGTGSQESDLTAREHGAGDPSQAAGENSTRIAQGQHAFDDVKRDLGAIVVVAVLGTPLVIALLDGVVEWLLLGGYGMGAGLWIHCRVRGVLAAAEYARKDRNGGA